MARQTKDASCNQVCDTRPITHCASRVATILSDAQATLSNVERVNPELNVAD